MVLFLNGQPTSKRESVRPLSYSVPSADTLSSVIPPTTTGNHNQSYIRILLYTHTTTYAVVDVVFGASFNSWKCHPSPPPSVNTPKSLRHRRHRHLHCPPCPPPTQQHSIHRILSNRLCSSLDQRSVHRHYSHRRRSYSNHSSISRKRRRHRNNIIGHPCRALPCDHPFEQQLPTRWWCILPIPTILII